MFKEVKYNQSFERSDKRSVYSQEHKLLHDFHSSDKQNMRFEYANKKQAHSAYD